MWIKEDQPYSLNAGWNLMQELELLPVPAPYASVDILRHRNGGRISSSSSKQVCIQVSMDSPMNVI